MVPAVTYWLLCDMKDMKAAQMQLQHVGTKCWLSCPITPCRDPRICPGCLGFAIGEEPDLSNVTFSITRLDEGTKGQSLQHIVQATVDCADFAASILLVLMLSANTALLTAAVSMTRSPWLIDRRRCCNRCVLSFGCLLP